jgi:hypothetical protein
VLRGLPLGLRDVAILLQGCTSAMFFEARKRKDCYLWLSKVPSGPTAKFLIVNGAPAAIISRFVVLLPRLSSCHGVLSCAPAPVHWLTCGTQPALQLDYQLICSCIGSCERARQPAASAATAVHTMAELKLSGNHLKGSRPVLSFDKVCLFMPPPAGHHFTADIAFGTHCHTCSAPCG